jgi:hypothetical protein
MGYCCREYKHVEYLVRGAKEIELPRRKSFRNTECVDCRSRNVKNALEDKIEKAHLSEEYIHLCQPGNLWYTGSKNSRWATGKIADNPIAANNVALIGLLLATTMNNIPPGGSCKFIIQGYERENNPQG